VAGLLALAMIASLLLVFSESVQLLRVGVVVALWAATVGAIAMNKYRRESALDKAKADDLKMVYELQLQREIAARREYELTVEEKVRADLRLEADEMAALRAELAGLRHTLEVLLDGRLPDDLVALEGQAERLRELDDAERVTAPRPSGPAFASPDDEPLTAETEAVDAAAARQTAEDDDAETGDVGTEDVAGVEDERETEPEPEDTAEPGNEVDPEDTAESGNAAEQADEDDDEPAGRRSRRRRADGAHEEGRTVAEILAALSSER